MLKLGWFSTGRGEGSRGLLQTVQESIQRGELQASIQFVFCNREPGEHVGSDQFLALVKSYGIPLITFSSLRYRRERGMPPFGEIRMDYDREAMNRLEGFSPDVCVLAGYMLVAGQEMCQRYTLLNLHPALPGGPVGTWQEVIWKLIGSRASQTGAMIHVATQQLDQGPVVSYVSFPIRGEAYAHALPWTFSPASWAEVDKHKSIEELKTAHGENFPLFQAIRAESVKRERPLLLETLKAFAQGEVRVVSERVVDIQGKPLQPMCLDSEIEAYLQP